MKLSDVIADFINSMLSDGDEVELQRQRVRPGGSTVPPARSIMSSRPVFRRSGAFM